MLARREAEVLDEGTHLELRKLARIAEENRFDICLHFVDYQAKTNVIDTEEMQPEIRDLILYLEEEIRGFHQHMDILAFLAA